MRLPACVAGGEAVAALANRDTNPCRARRDLRNRSGRTQRCQRRTAAAQRRRPGRSPVPARCATARPGQPGFLIVRTDRGACHRPACCRHARRRPGAAADRGRDRRSRPASGLCARPVPGRSRAEPAGRSHASRRDQPRPAPAARGSPQTRKLGHPPLAHQTLTVVDGFVAGLHRSCRQPGLSGEHHAGQGEVSSHRTCDLGADGAGPMRRSWQPCHAPRPGHAHVLLDGVADHRPESHR